MAFGRLRGVDRFVGEKQIPGGNDGKKQVQRPRAKAPFFVGFFRGLKPPANPVEQVTATATAKAKARATAKANTGILRFALG